MGVVEKAREGEKKKRKKKEPKLNTFVSALTYHKSYENRGLIVFTLQVHPPPLPSSPLSLHHHPTPPPSSTPPPPCLTQLPADASCVCSPSAGANLQAPADLWALPHLRFYYLTSLSPPLLTPLTPLSRLLSALPRPAPPHPPRHSSSPQTH